MLDGELEPAAQDLRGALPLTTNTPAEKLVENVLANYQRGLNELPLEEFHDRPAVIVGGGPSAADWLWHIKHMKEQGAAVFALNGAAPWLASQGIIPDALIIMDARPSNVRFIEATPAETHLYICYQCDPSMFEAAKDRPVTAWHRSMNGETGIFTMSPVVGAGTTVGISALYVCAFLGHKEQHLYGLDSSFRDAEGHAYDQPENANDRPIDIDVDGTVYHAAPWMIRQADAFRGAASELRDCDVEFHVHGDGLLPHIAHKMAESPIKDGVLTMLYDLSSSPVGFNFLEWMLNAEALRVESGADKLKVVFSPGPNEGFRKDTLPESLQLRRQMYDNVVLPAIRMAGAEHGGIGCFGGSAVYVPEPAVQAYRKNGHVLHWKPSQEAREWADYFIATRCDGKAPIVITLREAEHWPERNSNVSDWLLFADRLIGEGEKVIIVRDAHKASDTLPGFTICPEASVDVEMRAALYERAKLNAMRCNGPYIVASCLEGDVPLMVLGMLYEHPICGSPEWYRRAAGLEVGESFPWFSERQRFVWEPDGLDNIDRAYRALQPLLG